MKEKDGDISMSLMPSKNYGEDLQVKLRVCTYVRTDIRGLGRTACGVDCLMNDKRSVYTKFL